MNDPLILRAGRSEEAVSALYSAFAARASPVAVLGEDTPLPLVPEGVDVVVRTSGSTDGTGRFVGLSYRALTASADATHAVLSGPGQWVSMLPIDHVAGLQVVYRAARAGTPPLVARDAADLDALRAAAPTYLSLVPTQLHRLLCEAPQALARFTAVLVGGAALAPALLRRAEAAAVRVVRTYGMTETAGGCVYDGVPLPGVVVDVEEGRARIAGPVLAEGYLGDVPQPFTTDRDGTRWLLTADRARWVDGRLEVLGRADDVIISGGVNVAPQQVEAALLDRLGGIWAVVGAPDPEWGQRVVAVREGGAAPGLGEVRAALADLAAALRPRQVLAVEQLPRTRLGKLDRRTLAEQVRRMDARGNDQ